MERVTIWFLRFFVYFNLLIRGLVNQKKNLHRIKSAIETLILCFIDFYRTAIKRIQNWPVAGNYLKKNIVIAIKKRTRRAHRCCGSYSSRRCLRHTHRHPTHKTHLMKIYNHPPLTTNTNDFHLYHTTLYHLLL